MAEPNNVSEQVACVCGDCNRLVIGPNTDGEPCDWCQNCGCSSAEHGPRECRCYACIGSEPVREGSWVTLGMTRMIVCETCGNKRCPHGTDHRNECTGSNEPNQDGSRYQYGPIRGDKSGS